MKNYRQRVLETAAFLKRSQAISPEIGLMTGTGLGGSTDAIKVIDKTPYSTIPNFPTSTVESHKGELIYGSLGDHAILTMQGRFHLYEGYSPLEVTFPIRVMQELGIQTLIITNASGGINLDFSEGDIMIINDHINLTGENPLAGPNLQAWGVRFPDMTRVYDRRLSNLAVTAAKHSGFSTQTGIYAGLKGPSLETPAETRYLGIIGCDAVGFSTVLEAITATHAGMAVLGLSAITNINNPDAPEIADIARIIQTAEKASKKIGAIISGVVDNLDQEPAAGGPGQVSLVTRLQTPQGRLTV